MRALLAFLAALGLPLAALAQPAAGAGKSSEVSELEARAREATALPGLTVKAGCPTPPELRWPDRMFDAQSGSKNKRTQESPGTREYILRDIAAIRNNTRDYKHMSLGLARIARQQRSSAKLWIVCRGVFKDIKFLHVTQNGDDDFEVDFSGGPLEWEVKPLDSHQVTEQFAIRFFLPQPATQQFEDLLNSMQRGRPDYAALTPDFAAKVQAQWPTLDQTLKDWGKRAYVLFLRQEDDGSYTYEVGFGQRKVIWSLAPLDPAGKIAALSYTEKQR